MNNLNHLLAFCSPAGSTAMLAETIKNKLNELNIQAISLNLANPDWPTAAKEILPKAENGLFLWLGSPVYAHHPVPPVQAFLDWLPKQSKHSFAVPFVTWGKVCSGTALLEMGETLEQKGLTLAGAAKIPAVHSSMWKFENPLGQGRPNQQDQKELQSLVHKLIQDLNKEKLSGISAQILDFQPEKNKEFAKGLSIEKVKKMHPGYSLDQDKCTQCGTCMENCPAGAITLDPYPQISQDCFLCNNCARLCPEGAMDMDVSGLEKRIQDMQKQFAEDKDLEIFC